MAIWNRAENYTFTCKGVDQFIEEDVEEARQAATILK
jgi:hypothetical protein